MRGMLVSKENSDLTFVCDDLQTIKAHKNILSASSPAFEKMFGYSQGTVMFLYMRGIKHNILESLLEFIYVGEVHFQEECLEEFISVARSLEITGLNETSNNEDRQDEEIDENVSCKNEPEDNNDCFLFQEGDCINISDVTLNEVNHKKTEQISTETMIKPAKMTLERMMRRQIGAMSQSKTKNASKKCKSCGKVLADFASLSRHKRSIHDGVKYPCKYCDYQATYYRNLDRHVAAKHTSSVN